MADHIWTVLCDKHLIDPRHETISLIDVIEHIEVPDLSSMLEEASRSGKKGALVKVPMRLVSWWFRSDPSEKALVARISLVSPSGEQLFVQPVEAPWKDESEHQRLYVNLDGLPVHKPGRSWFVIEQPAITKNKIGKWVVVARIPLEIS